MQQMKFIDLLPVAVVIALMALLMNSRATPMQQCTDNGFRLSRNAAKGTFSVITEERECRLEWDLEGTDGRR